MKLKIQNTKLVKLGFCLVALAAVASFVLRYFERASDAAINFTHHPSSSFGIVAGQTARLNVVNADARERKLFVLRFLNENGSVLKTERVTVEPKHSFGLLLPASEIGRDTVRAQIHAEVFMQGDRSNRLPGSVEVFDEATGKTSFGLLLPASDFDPQPEPPAPQ